MNHETNTKKLNNKGFSLVELIIVVAIMAVLVGVLAPQYLKYVDRSRKGVDEQLCDNLRTAMQTTHLDPAVDSAAIVDVATKTAIGAPAAADYWKEVYDIMNVTDAAGLKALLKLDPTSGDIKYTLSNGNFTVYVEGGKYTGTLAIEVK